ncbi:cytochrome b/b6 domain-containing protein [Sphingomonas changnyeongensis]|nr:cytochrome b/b6 domain-containing protein [Sphingomonas changnyeongensis]
MTDTHPARRWDPVVKLTHWSVALAVLANAVITEEGSAAHVWVGYALAAILGLRLLWGLVGPPEARFAAFPLSLGRAVAHLRDIRAGRHVAHRSHNPLGALMVYAIWATLLVVIGTGIAMAGLPPARTGARLTVSEASARGEAAQHRADSEDRGEHEREERGDHGDGEQGEGIAEEVHEATATLLYGLILLHVAGVAFESRRQRRNLALAMLPGRG